jgi:hypothetical protein
MIWIFATTVLLLIVYNAAFRRFAMWAGGALAVATLILFGAVAYKDYENSHIDPSKVTWDAPPASANVFDQFDTPKPGSAVPDSDLSDSLKKEQSK